MYQHPTPLQVMTTRAREGGPKEHSAKQKWQREIHPVTYAPGLSTLTDRAATTVIPLLPKATFTPSIQPNPGLGNVTRKSNYQLKKMLWAFIDKEKIYYCTVCYVAEVWCQWKMENLVHNFYDDSSGISG